MIHIAVLILSMVDPVPNQVSLIFIDKFPDNKWYLLCPILPNILFMD